MADKSKIYSDLKSILSNYCPPFEEKKDNHTDFHIYGTKPVKVGKRTYDSISFASATIRSKHVTLGFFPIYTHTDRFKALDPELKKHLAGKNCFHIKTDDPHLYESIEKLLDKGMEIYKNEGWA